MFDPKIINDLLRATPFKPFRICMSDGKAYEVRFPETVFATTAAVLVAVEFDADKIPDDIVRCGVPYIANRNHPHIVSRLGILTNVSEAGSIITARAGTPSLATETVALPGTGQIDPFFASCQNDGLRLDSAGSVYRSVRS